MLELLVPAVLLAVGGLVLFSLEVAPANGDAQPSSGAGRHVESRTEAIPTTTDVTAPRVTPHYPTLVAIDRLRGDDATPFASDEHAAHLEPVAADVVRTLCGEHEWPVNAMPVDRLDAICRTIELRRSQLRDPVITLDRRDPFSIAGD